MFFKPLKYLKFLYRSTNQHGIHSPFVYQWATQCLYAKPRLGKNNCEEIVLKSIAYFDFQNVQVIGNAVLQEKISHQLPKKSLANKPLDVLCLENPNWGEIDKLANTQGFHNNTMIFMNNIHTSALHEKQWIQLTKNTIFTLSIDLFHCGVLFFRKEQLKEHFTIRT